MGFMLILMLILNIGISLWNAYATGKAWVEAKYAGGWPRFMTWMGAVMAASGLSWCILILLIMGAVAIGKLTPYWGDVGLSLGYLVIIPGILFSGLMIAIDSWARAFRTRKILDFGVAGYNSFAQLYNTYHAIRGIGPAFSKVREAFFGNKGKKDGATLVLILVVLSLGAGILITAAIIHHVAAKTPLPSYQDAAASSSSGKPSFKLQINGSQIIELSEDKPLDGNDVPGLPPPDRGKIIGQLKRNPAAPSILGLTNLTNTSWTATVADGSEKRIDPGKSIKLAAGTKIDFCGATAQVL